MNKLMKILIVDDAKSIRFIMDVSLHNAGYEITQANNGREALEIAQQQQFDLVLTDINMPEMDGFTLITKLRQLPAYAHTPILTLTTEDSEQKKQHGKSVGATGWITKPFSPEKLTNIVINLLGKVAPNRA